MALARGGGGVGGRWYKARFLALRGHNQYKKRARPPQAISHWALFVHYNIGL